MTLVLLITAIQAFLEEKLADDVTTVPTVHRGLLPPKTSETRNDPVYPLILVLPVDGKGKRDSSIAQIKLRFGTQSDDNDGFIDVLNLMERVKILLMRQGIIENKYRIHDEWEWKFFEDQPAPQWVADLITTWDLPQIRQEVKGL